jgi:outer membrane protein assembly factor BamA
VSADDDKTAADDDDTTKKPKARQLDLCSDSYRQPDFRIRFGHGGRVCIQAQPERRSFTAIHDRRCRRVHEQAAAADSSSAARLYFSENKYQTAFAFGKGKANYDYFGIGRVPGREGISVEINQSGAFVFGEFMRNFGKKIFVGPRYQYRKLTAHLGGETTPGGFEIPVIDLVSTTAAIGFHVQRDLRDSTFYPRRGSLMDFKADFFAKPLGSNRNYQTYLLSYSGFRSLGPKQVLAYNATACSVSDAAPFFDLCFFGARSILRGYTCGRISGPKDACSTRPSIDTSFAIGSAS